jgi:hypothetical protein
VTNFMNYAVDSCMSEFTPGQAARVRETVEQFKPTLCANMPLGVCRAATSVVAMSGPPSDATVSVAESPPPSTSHSANHPSTSCADETSSSFLVTLKADDFPTEIAWRLTREERIDETSGYLVSVDGEEDVIASVAFGSLVEPGGEWSWRLCLEPGRYLFELEDSWGDGLCCEWGEGRWDAWLDDVWIGGGDGNYGEGVTKKFDARVPEGTTFAPPRSAPPPPPPPPPPVAPSAPLDPPPAPASPAAPQDPPAPPNAPPPPPRPPRATLGGLLFPGRDFLSSISA